MQQMIAATTAGQWEMPGGKTPAAQQPAQRGFCRSQRPQAAQQAHVSLLLRSLFSKSAQSEEGEDRILTAVIIGAPAKA